jgi:hypothetical protein
MKKLVLSAVGILIVIGGFGGCGKLTDSYYIDPLTEGNLSKVIELKNKLDDCGITTDACKNHTCNNYSKCIGERNAALSTLIMTSDEMCMAHIAGILGNEATANLSFGSLTTFLAGASTVSTVTTSKSILSGLATFSSAERSLMNDVVYKSMIAPVITRKISDHRLEKRRSLIKRMQDENLTTFSLDSGLMDVIDYHNSCSFIFGLEKALKEGEQDGTKLKKQALEEQLTVLRAQRSAMESNSYKDKDMNDYNLTKERIESIQKKLIELDSLK